MKKLLSTKKPRIKYFLGISHQTWSILIVILLTVTALVMLWVVQSVDAKLKMSWVNEVKAMEAIEVKQELAEENIELKAKLERSAQIETSANTKALAVEYIKRYFPEPNIQETVMKIVKCESNFNNLAFNKNNNGSVDKGIFQINSIHSKAFKKVTGFDYEVGANDFDANTKYARYIYDTQGHFNAWVCSRLVGK